MTDEEIKERFDVEIATTGYHTGKRKFITKDQKALFIEIAPDKFLAHWWVNPLGAWIFLNRAFTTLENCWKFYLSQK